MERIHDEETCKRINNILYTRTSVQVEHSHDAVRIRAKNDRFLHKQLEHPNRIGELFLQSLHGKFGRETG